MHVYNAIIVLKEILPVFPLASSHETAGVTLEKAMERFVEKEERGDLKILGRAYHASLKKREPLWAPPAKPSKVGTLCRVWNDVDFTNIWYQSIPTAPSSKASPENHLDFS